MNIGVDVSCWANKRGYGRYTRELLRELLSIDAKNNYRLFLDNQTDAQSKDLPDTARAQRVVVKTSTAATQAASASGRRSLRDLLAMRRAVGEHRDLDVFYFPSVYTFFPVKTKAKVVVTIHDTIAEQFPSLIFPNKRSEWFWRIKVRWAIAQADLLVAVSETARRDVARQFALPEDSVRVVSDAVSAEFRPLPRQMLTRYGVADGQRFILYVGGISPHKNLATLVDAFAALRGEWKLVLVGDYQKDVFYSSYTALQEQLQRLNLSGRVIFAGYVPDAELVHFYNAAEVLVLPSFGEGFGLPAMEAMACGVPVVASRAGALPEVVEDAGLLFDPHSARELEDCLRKLLENEPLRRQLGQNGLRRAAQFSWRRSAQNLLAVFEELGR